MGRPLLVALLAATATAYTHVQSELMALIEKDIADIYAAERARAEDGAGLERRAEGRPSVVDWDDMMKCLAVANCRAYVCERADPFMYQYMLSEKGREAGAQRKVGDADWVDPIRVYGQSNPLPDEEPMKFATQFLDPEKGGFDVNRPFEWYLPTYKINKKREAQSLHFGNGVTGPHRPQAQHIHQQGREDTKHHYRVVTITSNNEGIETTEKYMQALRHALTGEILPGHPNNNPDAPCAETDCVIITCEQEGTSENGIKRLGGFNARTLAEKLVDGVGKPKNPSIQFGLPAQTAGGEPISRGGVRFRGNTGGGSDTYTRSGVAVLRHTDANKRQQLHHDKSVTAESLGSHPFVAWSSQSGGARTGNVLALIGTGLLALATVGITQFFKPTTVKWSFGHKGATAVKVKINCKSGGGADPDDKCDERIVVGTCAHFPTEPKEQYAKDFQQWIRAMGVEIPTDTATDKITIGSPGAPDVTLATGDYNVRMYADMAAYSLHEFKTSNNGMLAFNPNEYNYVAKKNTHKDNGYFSEKTFDCGGNICKAPERRFEWQANFGSTTFAWKRRGTFEAGYLDRLFYKSRFARVASANLVQARRHACSAARCAARTRAQHSERERARLVQERAASPSPSVRAGRPGRRARRRPLGHDVRQRHRLPTCSGDRGLRLLLPVYGAIQRLRPEAEALLLYTHCAAGMHATAA